MMPPFVVFPTNRIAHFVEVSLYLFYLAQQVNLFLAHTAKFLIAVLFITLSPFIKTQYELPYRFRVVPIIFSLNLQHIFSHLPLFPAAMLFLC